jgi:hypothetical protein
MPRLTNLPHADRRFVVSRFEHGRGDGKVTAEFTLDRDYAREYALDLLSVCDPVAWAALQRLALHAPPPALPPKQAALAAVLADEPERNSSSAPARWPPAVGEKLVSAKPGTCPCGKPSALANGACEACALAAVG